MSASISDHQKHVVLRGGLAASNEEPVNPRVGVLGGGLALLVALHSIKIIPSRVQQGKIQTNTKDGI